MGGVKLKPPLPAVSHMRVNNTSPSKKAGGLRFHCAIPGCQGLLASGANLWEHVAEHNAQAALWGDAEARAAETEARRLANT